MPDLETIRVLAEIGTAFGTIGLTIVTYRTLREMQKERTPTLKIDVIESDIGILNEWGAYLRDKESSGLAIGFKAVNIGNVAVMIEHFELWVENKERIFVPIYPSTESPNPYQEVFCNLFPRKKYIISIAIDDLNKSLLKKGYSGEVRLIGIYFDVIENRYESKVHAFKINA